MNMFSYAYVMTFVIFNVCQLNRMINQSKVGDNRVSTNGSRSTTGHCVIVVVSATK